MWHLEEYQIMSPAVPPSFRCCVQGLRAEEQSVLVQCIALKMLTDFTLMYTLAVGLVIRRDADAAIRGCSPCSKTPRKDTPG